ncbi:Protein tilB [Taenia crassiceps]|uniref:Protein tilB n=1 Tax=Taenia crassiceps TaxID=6207 RepID=A0ABR4QFG5_9CEST
MMVRSTWISIKNINRLKELEYLNLALNNIEVIENLEETRTHGELYRGLDQRGKSRNPCTDYTGYREYVVATLPQLKALEKVQAQRRKERFSQKLEENNGDIRKVAEEFWQEKGPYTPESRCETYEFLRLQKEQESKKSASFERTKPKRKIFFAEDGRPYNINEAKIEFKFYEEILEDGQYFALDIAAYKNMDTSLIDCDVQTNYVRVTLRNKVFQMALPEEVHPDKSSVQRSRVTGRLLVRMPKVKGSSLFGHVLMLILSSSSIIEPQYTKLKRTTGCVEKTESKGKTVGSKSNFLTVGETTASVDWRNITNARTIRSGHLEMEKRVPVNCRKERENSPSFVDNLDVPPLE